MRKETNDQQRQSKSIDVEHQNEESLIEKTNDNKLPSRIDRLLDFYVKFVSKASNQDKCLKLLQWSLYMASIGFATKYRDNKHRMASGFNKLYNELSMARYVIRLLGFPTALEALRTDSWSLDASNPLYRWIGKLLAGSMLIYYPTELLAYTHWTAPQLYPYKSPRPREGNRWSYISCRFWVLYIVAELVQGVVQWKELKDKIQAQQQRNHQLLKATTVVDSATKTASSSSSSSAAASHNVITVDSDEDEEENNNNSNKTNDEQISVVVDDGLLSAYKNNQLQVYRNLLFLLPCVHWSLPNWDTQPWLPEKTVNSLMWFESIVCMYQAIIGQK